MTVPANYATLVAEIDAVIDDYTLTLQEVTGGLTVKPSLDRLIDLRYKLFEAGGSGGSGGAITRSQVEFTEPQLTAPGTTASRSFAGYALATIQVDVASINTSVTLRIEGSNNGTTWFNMSTSSTDTVITANGPYGFQFESCPEFVRVNFVSEVGGTSATIDVITRFSA